MASGTKIADAYVQILPTTKNISGNIEESLKGVDKKFDVAGIAAGTAFGNAISNVVSKAVTAVAKFASDTLKDSIASTADYEQLKGGIDKIFSGMDTSKITADAKNAYKELGMSVNEYLNSINQIGATFKANMGSEEAYNTARRGLQAISDYASGTGRSLDELSEKYKMITRSTSSYQSIADQFSGILPATSKQFLEAAQNAGLLSDSYRNLSEVPIDEYQKAVTEMLEKGVSALGLTNNTAKEASNTLSGSFNQMKKAWDNLVESFTNPDLDTSAMTERFIDAVKDFLENLGPVIQEAAPALVEALSTALVEAGPAIVEIIAKSFINASKKLPSIMARQLNAILRNVKPQLQADNLFDGLVNGFMTAFSKITQLASGGTVNLDGITDGIAYVIRNFDELSKIAEKAISAISKIRDIGDTAFGGLTNIVNSTRQTFNEFLGNIREISSNAFSRLGEAARTAAGDIKNAFASINLSNFSLDSVANAFSKLKDAIRNFVNSATSTVKQWGSDLLDAGRSAIEKFITGVVDGLKKMITKLKNSGHEMAAGLIEGFTSRLQDLSKSAVDTVDKLVQSIKDALQIHSPSRLMRDQVGAMMAQGLKIGWSAEMSRVNASIDADIQKEYSFGQDAIINSMRRQPRIEPNNNMASEIIKAMQNITVQNNVTLEGDAGKLFTAMQNQNRVFRNSTGRSAFA